MKLLFKKAYITIGTGILCMCLLTVGLSQSTAQSTTENSSDTNAETTSESVSTTSTEAATDSEEKDDTDASAEATKETSADASTDTATEADNLTGTEEGEVSNTDEATSTEAMEESPAEADEAQVDSESTEEVKESNTAEDTSTEMTEETQVDGESTEGISVSEEVETTSTAADEVSAETADESSTEVSAESEVESSSPELEEEGSQDLSSVEEANDEISGEVEEASVTETDDTDTKKANERVITIEYSGGTRKAVDFRYGPWIYSHPEDEGIIGKVGVEDEQDKKDEDSQLSVYAKEAELKAPEEVLIATAGERVANFTGGVRVQRKRLTAIGEALEYSEETGFGELSAQERVDITVAPKENDGDITTITAASATFDVDTDVSISRGEVTLESGTQSAEAESITFEQGLDLAVMTSPDSQVVIKRGSGDDEVTITADTVRVLTNSKKLMASGNVTLVDGSIMTTGEVVFFDDEIERAEVFGTAENLAKSVDSEFDVTLTGQRLEQRIDLDLVQILDETAEIIWDEADFLLTSELSTE